jgi:hypothetical protein
MKGVVVVAFLAGFRDFAIRTGGNPRLRAGADEPNTG